MKYIIDTDPGIDDAIAIMLGIKNNLDVIGFTLSDGNIAVDKSEKNLKVIQDFLETDIKMYRGSMKHLKSYESAEYVHGKDGLGYAVFPNYSKRKIEKTLAEDFIIKASKKYKDKLTIVCFGALTNLANAIIKDPTLVKRLKHVVIMGTTYAPEAEEPYKEFNVNIDPDAAVTVFSSDISDIKVVTHEIGVRSFVEKEYIENLKNSEDLVSRFLSVISIKYMEFSKEHYGTIGLGTPDPTTIASIINPEIVKFEPCTVEIIKKPNGAFCEVNLTDESNIMVSTDFDIEKFRKLFKETFK